MSKVADQAKFNPTEQDEHPSGLNSPPSSYFLTSYPNDVHHRLIRYCLETLRSSRGDVKKNRHKNEIHAWKVAAHDRAQIQVNPGRENQQLREFYRVNDFLVPSLRLFNDNAVMEEVGCSVEKFPDEELFVSQEFMPSLRVVTLVTQYMKKADAKTIAFLEGIYGSELGKREERRTSFVRQQVLHLVKKILHRREQESFSSVISERVENFLTDSAKRASLRGHHKVWLSQNTRFTTDACEDLSKRFDLDIYNAKEVFDALYGELVKFAKVPRERIWGQVKIENSELLLVIQHPDVFVTPKINTIDRDQWEVSS